MTQLRYKIKVDPLIYLENWKIQSEVKRLRHLVTLRDKQGHVSLYLLKKVNEQGKELQRTLDFYQVKKHWTEFLDNGDE